MARLFAKIFAVMIIVFAVAHSSGRVWAQDWKPVVVGVVAVQAVMKRALATRSIQDQIELRRNSYQTEISNEETRLRQLEVELTRQQSVLAPDAFAQRRQEFEKQVAAVQRSVQERRRGLEKAYADGVRKLQLELTRIIGAIAQERGIDIVVPRSQILFAVDELSLSDEALKRLDASMPELTLDFSSE